MEGSSEKLQASSFGNKSFFLFSSRVFFKRTAGFQALANEKQDLLERPEEKMDVHIAFLPVSKGASPGAGRMAEEFYQRFIDPLCVVFSRAFKDVLRERALRSLPYKGLCIAFFLWQK